MKRTPMPPRTRPMPAGKPLARRTPMPRAGAPAHTRRRAGTDPGRAARREAEALVRRGVFDRDRGCRLAHAAGTPPCMGRLTFHHLRKAGQGGEYSARNGLALCCAHNDWVEEDTTGAAQAWGLVVRRGDCLVSAWARLITHGIVWWWWDGTPGDGSDPITREETSAHG